MANEERAAARRLDEALPARVDSPSTPTKPASDDKMMCERCGVAEMYRMHAVWRCPACGYKTDCCGW